MEKKSDQPENCKIKDFSQCLKLKTTKRKKDFTKYNEKQAKDQRQMRNRMIIHAVIGVQQFC